MNWDQLINLERSMDRIDRGQVPARLSGQLGLFLQKYGESRRSLVEHAITEIEVYRDGSISGKLTGDVDVYPITEGIDPREVETDLGDYVLIPALCPQLLSLIDIKLNLNSRRGLYMLQLIRSMEISGASAIRLSGAYRWLPPLRLTPFRAVASQRFDIPHTWTDAVYLHYVAEDIEAMEDPIEHRIIQISDPPLFGHVRVAHGLLVSSGVLVLPNTQSEGWTDISFQTKVDSDFEDGEPVTCVLVREPHIRDWLLRAVIKRTVQDVLQATVEAALYVYWLLKRRSPGSSHIGRIVAANLKALGCGLNSTDLIECTLNRWEASGEFARFMSRRARGTVVR